MEILYKFIYNSKTLFSGVSRLRDVLDGHYAITYVPGGYSHLCRRESSLFSSLQVFVFPWIPRFRAGRPNWHRTCTTLVIREDVCIRVLQASMQCQNTLTSSCELNKASTKGDGVDIFLGSGRYMARTGTNLEQKCCSAST